MKTISLAELETDDPETGEMQVIIETPRGSSNKFAYDIKKDLFKLKKVLPAGFVFPYDFGFIPSTLGEDGDPLDVMLFMDEPVYPGNLITARLIGAIEAEQSEDGKTMRNDRLIAVGILSQDYKNVKELTDLDPNLVTQIEHFFVSYNQVEGKKFKPLGRPNAKQAGKILEQGRKRFQQRSEQS
ncbi:MAG: Inorganic diphosphatase [Chthonomonadaceae bacterium]|nr:Inorganic diphosphatase [Chthonomonadaceae bacterium]